MTDITKMSDEDWVAVARYVGMLIPAAPEPVARVPVAMTEGSDILTVACNDGTVWYLMEQGTKWVPVAPIPQPDAPKFALQPARFGLTPSQAEAQERDRAETEMHAEFEEQTAKYGTDPVRDAAPQLLAAVLQCRAHFAFYVRHHGGNDAQDKAATNQAFVDLCDSAIAKAEGNT